MVDWTLALVFVFGGALGGVAGSLVAHHLSTKRGTLGAFFAALIVLVAIYMLYRSIPDLLA